jgi:hypothetical protein
MTSPWLSHRIKAREKGDTTDTPGRAFALRSAYDAIYATMIGCMGI